MGLVEDWGGGGGGGGGGILCVSIKFALIRYIILNI